MKKNKPTEDIISKTTKQTSGMALNSSKLMRKITGTFFKKEKSFGSHMPLTKSDKKKMVLVGGKSTTLNTLTT
jgi:predicted RNA binding protein YcfA (HicA-like mRNA interferase family)